MNDAAKKPRTKPTTNRMWIVEAADGSRSYVRAVNITVAKDTDTYAIIDGKIPAYSLAKEAV